MKYIDKLAVAKNKNIVIAGGVLFTSLLVAAMVYLGLSLLMPRSSDSNSTSSDQVTKLSKDQLAKQADAFFVAGDKALQIGDAEKGIAELKKAKALYEQLGDLNKLDQIKDQISMAEHALKVQKEYVSAEKQTDKGKALQTP